MDLQIEILNTARSAVAHASQRHALIAENIAHADTPGYHARDLTDFSETYRGGIDRAMALKATRSAHIQPERPAHGAEIVNRTAFAAESPNGNTVSLEDQMVRGVEAQRQHTMALAVWQKSLDILRFSLGRR